jgi:hypothetical protein
MAAPDALPNIWWVLLLSPLNRLRGRPVRSVTWPALPPDARRRSGVPLLMSLLRSMVKRMALLPLGADAREYVAFGSTVMSMSAYSGE